MKTKFYLTSPYMTDPDYIWKEIRSRGSISRAGFTKEQILDAGIWGAHRPLITSATGPFRRELYKTQKTEPATEWMLGEYWMLLNNDYDPVSLLQKVLDEKPRTLESVNTLMSRFNDWSNDVPRWILKGNSSRHIFETHEKPKLRESPPQMMMGPNARKAGITIPQEEFNKIWEDKFQKPEGKIGRNAPCTCGSGRKYKNCCLSPN
jgi:hypothetical protein